MKSKENQDKIFADLMRKAQVGDKVIYEELLKKLIPLLNGFIYNKIGNRADNEDILQEILIAIHKSAHTYNTDRSFTNWMFAIANYKVQDFLRYHYRKNRIKQVDFDEVKDFLTDDVTKQTVQNESLAELINNLPEKQRKILYLLKIDGHSIKEVADVMKMNLSAVKVAAHRAYKILVNNKKLNDQSEN